MPAIPESVAALPATITLRRVISMASSPSPPVTTNRTAILWAAVLARVRVAGGEYCQHDEVGRGRGHRRDLHRQLEPEKIRAEDAFSAEFLEQFRRNVRRLQPRHHQDVGRAGQSRERIIAPLDVLIE